MVRASATGGGEGVAAPPALVPQGAAGALSAGMWSGEILEDLSCPRQWRSKDCMRASGDEGKAACVPVGMMVGVVLPSFGDGTCSARHEVPAY
jgi:hypothetical protein